MLLGSMRKSLTRPLFLISLLSLFSHSIAVNTLTPNQPLADGERLVSAGGSFALGFFSPTNSKNRYIGIWYNNIPNQTVVWVANRQHPITDSTGRFTIDRDGTLTVVNQNSTVLWSSVAARASNPVAQLLDNGNFVVREANSNDTKRFVWQSFDHPTDTLLPGMKLGLNLITGLNRNITSWRSVDDPSPGDYCVAVDIRGNPQATMWYGSVRKWWSGPWNGVEFTGPPVTSNFSILTYNFVKNKEEIYCIYDILDMSTITRLVINNLGVAQQFRWLDSTGMWSLLWYSPMSQCDGSAVCGGYGICDPNSLPICSCLLGFEPKSDKDWNANDGSGGCVRKTALDCLNGTDGFMKESGALLPDTLNTTVNMDMNLDECKAVCLNNCSCTGYASADVRGNGSGCIIWVSELVDIQLYKDGGQDLYVRLAAADLDKEKAVLLDWKIRYHIITGIARGILYLHQDSRVKIIHRDLKASNILLDNEMNPKISDFGMARIFGGDETESKTSRVVGTYGYMPPEYVIDGIFSVKSDVFSFGVLVLEIISGQKNRGVHLSEPQLYLLGHAWRLWKEGRSLELVDPSMGHFLPMTEVMKCIEVGLLCVQECSEDRPMMSSVVLMLGSNTSSLPEPKQSSFVAMRGPSKVHSSSYNQPSCSENSLTVTMSVGR